MKSIREGNPLYVLAICGFVERLINFGVFTVLVLRLQQFFHLTDHQSFLLFGLFTALSYAGLVIGGFTADRWLGLWHSILFGGCLIFMGAIFLAFSQINEFYLGLSLLVAGTALYKVSCTSMVGQISFQQNGLHERNFTWFYAAMNAGAVLGPILYGSISLFWGWEPCLFLSAGLIALALILFSQNKQIQKNQLTKIPTMQKFSGYAVILLVCLIAFSLFEYPNLIKVFVIMAVLAMVILLLLLILKQSRSTRKTVIGLFGLNVFCMIFFACSFQVASSITLFVQRNIDKSIVGWPIPTPVFSALDPFFVVLMAPVLTMLWRYLAQRNREPSVMTKISLALGMACLAFFTLDIVAWITTSSSHITTLIFLLFAYLLLGTGEICLTPPVFAAISQHAPVTLKSTMIGIWYLFIAGAGYLAGLLSQLSASNGTVLKLNVSIYQHAFFNIALLALIVCVVAFILRPIFQKIFNNDKNSTLTND
jgi:POT family proton-dependent oligopeptide transporter